MYVASKQSYMERLSTVLTKIEKHDVVCLQWRNYGVIFQKKFFGEGITGPVNTSPSLLNYFVFSFHNK